MTKCKSGWVGKSSTRPFAQPVGASSQTPSLISSSSCRARAQSPRPDSYAARLCRWARAAALACARALARARIARETRATGRLTLKPNASLLVLFRAEEDDHEEIAFGRRSRGDCLDWIVGQ